MRAAVVREAGAVPAVEDVGEPVRGDGQALVEVLAAPVNPIDLSIAAGRFYAGPPQTPYVPGTEGVGRVVEGDALAPGAVVRFESPAGYGRDGAMAERVAVEEAGAIPLPEGVDETLAACLGIAGLAAWLALEWRARLREGETALVLGATGAVGQVAVQGAKLLGAGRVVAAGRDAEALAHAAGLGADATVELRGSVEEMERALAQAAGGAGYDVIVDPVWGEPAVAAARAAAIGARLVNLGQSAAPEATLPSRAVRGKLLDVLGHSNVLAPPEVKRSAFLRMLEYAREGELRLDYERLPLERVAEAWERQAASPHRKLVLVPNPGA